MIGASVATLFAGGHAAACELCRQMGTTSFHISALGGDDFDDALTHLDDDSGIAHPAFVSSGGSWPRDAAGKLDVTVTYSYENLLNGGLTKPTGEALPASFIRQSIETALRLWASVVPIHFVEVPDDGKSYAMGSTQHGDIRLRHVFINGPDIPGQLPIAKARAWYPFGGTTAGDVEFDVGDPWQESGTLPNPDILGAATHEIGHSLGLAHTDVPEANMYWIFRRTKGLHDGWLHPDDIAGMRSIYGAGVGSVTPLSIPEPGTAGLLLAAMSLFIALSRVRSGC